MKRTFTILSIVLFVGLAFSTPTAADTSQGLFWRPVENDRVYYTVEMYDGGFPETEEIYFEVAASPSAIPDPLTDWTDIPFLDIDIFYVQIHN